MKMIPLALISLMATSVSGIKEHNLYWNTSNPIFRIDNTDHIIDVNDGISNWEYDQVNIICPLNPLEKHVIYSVSKEEFDSCRVWNLRPKIVALCDGSRIPRHFTITFRPFSPVPGGLEFKPGHDYYFISTSSPGQLTRRIGGDCYTNHMKVVFKVADNAGKSRFIDAMTPGIVPPDHGYVIYKRKNDFIHHKNYQRPSYERFFKNFSPFYSINYRQSY